MALTGVDDVWNGVAMVNGSLRYVCQLKRVCIYKPV